MLDTLQEEEDMLDKMEEDKENENPQKRGEEKKHEDGPKGNYETPKTELEQFGKNLPMPPWKKGRTSHETEAGVR